MLSLLIILALLIQFSASALHGSLFKTKTNVLQNDTNFQLVKKYLHYHLRLYICILIT